MTLRRAADLPPTAALLVEGGDRRIALSDGRNQYGHPASPRPGELAFGSSTASTISEPAFAAAEALRGRLAQALEQAPPAEVYRQGMRRVRRALRRLCGLEAGGGTDVLMAASGTDLHLVAACLVRASAAAALQVISVQGSETGSGLDDALAGRHFAPLAVCGGEVAKGDLIPEVGEIARAAFAIRDADGGLIDEASVEDEIDRRIAGAAAEGRQTLLVATDVTKTGLIAPGVATLTRLAAKWGERLVVLVDACQFRLSPDTLRAYLGQGFMVAVTGSKFLTGPAFCGALFVPRPLAARFADSRPPAGLGLYGLRGEWPCGWAAGEVAPPGCNLGLLLRWEAALHELAAFRALDPRELRWSASLFADAARDRIGAAPGLRVVETRPLDRAPIARDDGWDATQTIFSFRVRDPGAPGGFLGMEALGRLHRALAAEDGTGPVVRLGQPVACGRDGALRLCFSARHAVEARDAAGFSRLLASVGTAMDRVEALAAALAPRDAARVG